MSSRVNWVPVAEGAGRRADAVWNGIERVTNPRGKQPKAVGKPRELCLGACWGAPRARLKADPLESSMVPGLERAYTGPVGGDVFPAGVLKSPGLGFKERDRTIGCYPPETGSGANESRRWRDASRVRVRLLETRIGIWQYEQIAGPQTERRVPRCILVRASERGGRFARTGPSGRGEFAVGFIGSPRSRGARFPRSKSGACQSLALGGRKSANCCGHRSVQRSVSAGSGSRLGGSSGRE